MAVYMITHTADTPTTRIQRAVQDMPAVMANDRTWFVDSALEAENIHRRICPVGYDSSRWVMVVRVHRNWCLSDDATLVAWLRDPARTW